MTSSPLGQYRTDAHTSWSDRVKGRHARLMLAYLSDLVPLNSTVLEVGPGDGHFARAVKAARPDLGYSAIEPSTHFRDKLMSEGFAVDAAAVPPIARESGYADLVFACMLIENLPTSLEAGQFIMESGRVLSSHGIICLVFPNYLTWKEFFFDEHYTHSFVTTPRRVAHLLTSQGFEVLRTEHALGWFWVKGGLAKNTVRHASNVLMSIIRLPLVRWSCHYFGLGNVHWKLCKTFFESIVVVGRKRFDSVAGREG